MTQDLPSYGAQVIGRMVVQALKAPGTRTLSAEATEKYMSTEPSMYAPTENESDLADHLRSDCIVAIEKQGTETAAALLGLAPYGLLRLMSLPRWDLAVAFRAADRLGLPIAETVARSVNYARSNANGNPSATEPAKRSA